MICDTLPAGQLPPSKMFYMWKEYVTTEGDDHPQLITPWANPFLHEFPMDWMFDTVAAALIAKADNAPDEDWVLVMVGYVPVRIVRGDPEDEETA